MSDLIDEKLREVFYLAKELEDPNVAIVISALCGARTAGDDGMLAQRVQDYVKDVLLPKAQAAKNNEIASKN